MAETAKTSAVKVFTGTGSIWVADNAAEISAATDWTEVFYSLKDSLEISQTQPDATYINIDQKETAISTIYGSGEFTISFSVPDVSEDVLAFFFETEAHAYAPADHTGLKVGTAMKVVNKMLRIDASVGGSFIASSCDLIGVISKSSDGAMQVDVTGTVLAAPGGSGEDKELIFWNKTA